MSSIKDEDNPAMKTKAMLKMLEIAQKLQNGTPQIFNEKNSFLLDFISHKRSKITNGNPVGNNDRTKGFRIKDKKKSTGNELGIKTAE